MYVTIEVLPAGGGNAGAGGVRYGEIAGPFATQALAEKYARQRQQALEGEYAWASVLVAGLAFRRPQSAAAGGA